ncbi:MAG TPA: glycosyltransferase [Planctomycetota bacterium]|nr:glycosyltransferase [Planctomycetota bacterium]
MRILIIHATAGNGHKRAAEAVAAAYRAMGGGHDVDVIDSLDWAPPKFKTFYQQSFEQSVKHAPWFFGAMFHGSSEAARFRAFRTMRRIFNRVVAHDLCDEVTRRDPDVVINTHFLSLDALARRKRRGRLEAAIGCVVTDYVAHGYWVEPDCDRYWVPTVEVARGVHQRGVSRGKICVTGSPVDPVFAQPADREAARAALGIDPARRVVLVLGGGLGMGPVADIAGGLASRRDVPVALEVVCGKNERLKAEVEAMTRGAVAPVRVHGFVNTIPQLMAAADLVVTKPGGLTTSECLAIGRPMLLFEAMPGQEKGNADYFVGAGAARLIDAASAGAVIGELLGDRAKLDALAARARELSKPHAARMIAEDALALKRTPRRRSRVAAE